jgi:hypothetical protein
MMPQAKGNLQCPEGCPCWPCDDERFTRVEQGILLQFSVANVAALISMVKSERVRAATPRLGYLLSVPLGLSCQTPMRTAAGAVFWSMMTNEVSEAHCLRGINAVLHCRPCLEACLSWGIPEAVWSFGMGDLHPGRFRTAEAFPLNATQGHRRAREQLVLAGQVNGTRIPWPTSGAPTFWYRTNERTWRAWHSRRAKRWWAFAVTMWQR